jgi:hypothetical protein
VNLCFFNCWVWNAESDGLSRRKGLKSSDSDELIALHRNAQKICP